MLSQHTSTINCLEFTKDNTHLITGTADGTIAITRIGNWQVEKLWEKAHKGAAILDVAVHPSGKLMLSLASDCSLRTWNLIKGRQAYVVNLNSKSKDPKSLQKIVWSPNGERFMLFGGKFTEIWSIETGGILSFVEHSSKVVSGVWVKEKKIIVGYENGKLGIVNSESGDVKTVEAHESRVRSLNKLKKWFVTASSAGEIKVWDTKFNELAKIDCGCRITCMCLVDPIDVKTEKVEEEEEVQEESVVEQVELKSKKKKVSVSIDDEDNTVKKKKKKNKLLN